MKVCTLTASVSRNAGGLFNSVRRLSDNIEALPNTAVSVLGLVDQYTKADLAEWGSLKPQTFPVVGPASFGYSPSLNRYLALNSSDILHQHGIWQYISVASTRWHRRTGRPHLISPRGMLDPWALNNSRWKKRLAGWGFENRNLWTAACIHALCESEAQSIRAYGLKNPISIIPNGIDLPEIQNADCGTQNPPCTEHIEHGRKVLLYLGRIHPKKGLVNLLNAWSEVGKERGAKDWVLAIAGWDQGEHESELKHIATELELAWNDVRSPSPSSDLPSSVVFLGPKFGKDKAHCYANADAFILPSFSEGLPMTVLEAWSYSKPVLMTPECNIPEGFAADAAIRIDPNVESVTQGLRSMLNAPSSNLHALGNNGRTLASEKFSWPNIAHDMHSVYEWVLGSGPKPDCVQTT